MDELFLITQPAHLQKQISDKLSAEERDLIRADMVRERLKNVSRPVVKLGSVELTPERDKSVESCLLATLPTFVMHFFLLELDKSADS